MSRRRFVAAALSLIAGLATAAPGTLRADEAAKALILGGILFSAYSAIDNPPQDSEPGVVTFGTGVFDAYDREDTAGMVRLEYRPALWGWRTGPLLGAAATGDGGLYGFAGLRHDIVFADRLLVSFNLAIAAVATYGNGKDLASAGLFRTGFDVHYKLDGGSRVGVSFHHFSHAELLSDDDRNPGTETLTFTYTMPIGRF